MQEQGEKRKIRLAFYGDAPCVATGFGKVSSHILSYLHATGDYDIMCFGVNYQGDPHDFPFQIYPMLPNYPDMDPYGRKKMLEKLPQVNADIFFFLQDSFILTFLPELFNRMNQIGKQFRSLVYFPVDGEPMWTEWVQAMSTADTCVTYSQWGKKKCIEAFPGIESKLHVIPHGVDVNHFFPHPPEKIQQLRKQLFKQHADKFIVLNINRNQKRKDIPRTIAAFREFNKEHPDSIFYLHCAPVDVGGDLRRVVKHLGLEVGKHVFFPDNFNVNSGFPIQFVNDVYNCADVVVSGAVGEGFGLSSIEGCATCTPCIFPDNSALTEFFSDGRGFLCRSGDTPNMRTVMDHDNELVRPLMNINDMVKYLKRIKEKPEVGQKVAQKAYDWVTKKLQWNKHVVPQFDMLVKQLYVDLQTPRQETLVAPAEQSSWQKGSMV